MTASPQSTLPSTNANAANNPERLRSAKACLAQMLKGRPEIGAENPKYLLEMVEVLAHVSDEDQAVLSHPVTGLQTVLKYLPTPADIHSFLREHHARKEQFKPAPTSWKKIEDDPDAPWNKETDAERKKRVVEELLGYNPDKKGAPSKRTSTPPTEQDLKNLQLKSPDKPLTPQLIAKLKAEGYPFIPGRKVADAA